MNLNDTPYAAVAYKFYYPDGGFDDVYGLFATKAEARAHLRKYVPLDQGWNEGHHGVVDLRKVRVTNERHEPL